MDANWKPRLLIVDDEPLMLKSIIRLLSKENFEIVTANGSREALDLIAGGMRFDVVLCDRQMPGMSGPELRDAVVEVAPALRKRFVWMTGNLASMTEPVLEKPFSREQVVAALRAALAVSR